MDGLDFCVVCYVGLFWNDVVCLLCVLFLLDGECIVCCGVCLCMLLC